MTRSVAVLTIALAAVAMTAASSAGFAAEPEAGLPFGIPPELVQFVTPKDNPSTPEKIELGRKLFNDKRLSEDGSTSCATCHDPEKGFTDRLKTSKGLRDQVGMRNAPTVLNAMFLDSQFLDGRAKTLEDQASLPITNPIEMGMKNEDAVVKKIASIPEYQTEFRKVFGRPVNYKDMERAIASFERTIISGDAPIDRFVAGDTSALGEAERRGWTLFNGKGRCNSCHGYNPSYPFFTDNLFHNVGVAAHKTDFDKLAAKAVKAVEAGDLEEIDRMALATEFSELGRFLVTRNRSEIGAFKTNGLRDIVLTAPYMHDGSLATLWDVIDHYNKGGEPNPFLDGGIQRLGLSESEIDDLVALIANGLTSRKFAAQGKAEFERQRTVAQTNRPEREADVALGRKEFRGDIIPDPDKKDPAQIGGRPVR
jgi:cytochrome c peroxidase